MSGFFTLDIGRLLNVAVCTLAKFGAVVTSFLGVFTRFYGRLQPINIRFHITIFFIFTSLTYIHNRPYKRPRTKSTPG
ncbi:hypothetical protein FRC03_011714 [Tulasnella sp. 419]|nr:hypothetical protein FRC02_000314 [Tulasnella sp. 418]KAG8953587.1 hypothetical protein FRC03_011714 [Tulasnella sp. 419]